MCTYIYIYIYIYIYMLAPPKNYLFQPLSVKLCLVWKVFKIAANLEVSRRKYCKYTQICKSCAESIVLTNLEVEVQKVL